MSRAGAATANGKQVPGGGLVLELLEALAVLGWVLSGCCSKVFRNRLRPDESVAQWGFSPAREDPGSRTRGIPV